MSIRNKIRSLKANKCEFNIYLVEPDTKDNFSIPYVLAVPSNMEDGCKLIVESNNIEFDDYDKPIDFNTNEGYSFLIDNAINSVIGNDGAFSRLDYADSISAPFLMPVIPSVAELVPYFQQLSREAIEFNDTSSKLYRIDNQLCSIIEDTRRILAEDNHKIADKIFLTGYSASGVFAQRFAFLHPEIIDTVLVGGAGGILPIPPDCKNSANLEYPIGTKNFEKITGQPFNSEAYRKICFQHYLSEFETITKSNSRKNEFGFQAPKHDMSYLNRSVPPTLGKKVRSSYGINLWKRFSSQIKEYEKNGYSINATVFRNVSHSTGLISPAFFITIYQGKHFVGNSNALRNSGYKRSFLDIITDFRNEKNIFRKKLPEPNLEIDSSYAEHIKSIDPAELGFDLNTSLNQRGLKRNLDRLKKEYINFSPKTELNQEQIIELSQRFFQTVDPAISASINSILSGDSHNSNECFVDLRMFPAEQKYKYFHTKYDLATVNGRKYYAYNHIPMQIFVQRNSPDSVIYVPLNGNLLDLYHLVHELTHSWVSRNGDNSTNKILGEIAPQCMERLLDDFLIKMSDEDKKRYNFQEDVLTQDIKSLNIKTFVLRLSSMLNLETSSPHNASDLQYALAQIYQSRFLHTEPDDQKSLIVSFMEHIANDEYYQANRVMKVNFNNKFIRDLYISQMIEDFNTLTSSQDLEQHIISQEKISNPHNMQER